MSQLTEDVLRPLADACEAADGVAPFGEQTWLDLRSGSGGGFLFWDAEGTQLRGACHVGEDGTWAELAVHPDHRRRGTGRTMLERLTAEHTGVRVWAHGDLPGAAALATATGARRDRVLVHMALPVAAMDALPPAELPAGFTVRGWTPADARAWLAVNARAFSYHPEQGRVDEAALAERTAEDWFDPAGFLLIEDVTLTPPRLAAFHWTKLPPRERQGEVYVVGVDPAYQGRGLGRPVTLLGLHHLRAAGAQGVGLYVEGDNAPALRTYERLGFVPDSVDVMYAPARG